MNRLLNIGFEKVGHWELVNNKIQYILVSHANTSNILYAFIHNGTIKYIGETIQKLRKRLYGYQNPGSTQTTNIKNNAHILKLLKSSEEIDIYALPDNGLFHYGIYHLNIAAGLEVSLINKLSPIWNDTNKKKTASKKNSSKTIIKSTKVYKSKPTKLSLVNLNSNNPIFEFFVRTTYYNQGFFNIGKLYEKLLGLDGQKIFIYCGNHKYLIHGSINRSVNTNNTPRIMGRVELRDWFQENCTIDDKIIVEVLSPVSIWLTLKH